MDTNEAIRLAREVMGRTKMDYDMSYDEITALVAAAVLEGAGEARADADLDRILREERFEEMKLHRRERRESAIVAGKARGAQPLGIQEAD